MTLPAPNLDDRRFQELVDNAKRHVMQRCPEWTDHNVSDPGITLIETFAYMTDGLLFRLNRVPDRLYIKLLDLIGLKLLPATPARVGVTFWLSSPAQAPLVIPAGTQTATVRSETEQPVVFDTADDLTIVPCEMLVVRTRAARPPGQVEATAVDHTEGLKFGRSFTAFSPVPAVGDGLLVALTEAVPRCAVMLRFTCTIEGVGVDPNHPPLVWEAWNGTSWNSCDISTDETGGLNRNGAVVVHVPPSHASAVIDGVRAGWLRARVVTTEQDQPTYSSSPIIHGLAASTIGGTMESVHADIVVGEVLGVSEGVPGQSFVASRAPMVAGGAPAIVEVSTDDGWEEWMEVADFASSGPEDRHVTIDNIPGEVRFGPLIRNLKGHQQCGGVPPSGATIRLRTYAIGGGRRGNVVNGAIRTLKSSIPYVSAVENRGPAIAGVDGETIEEAKNRGPILLRTRGRAVTAEDFEQLTRQAAPEVARVRCVAAQGGQDAGAVRVLVVPAVPMERGRVAFDDLEPSDDLLARIAGHLDRVRLIGTRVAIEPPTYQGVTVVAQLRAAPNASTARIREEALERLNTYFNPIVGGPHHNGWPWGRPVQAGDAFSVLQGLPGVDLVEEVLLFWADIVARQSGEPTQRVVLDPDSLVFSFQHEVRVRESA